MSYLQRNSHRTWARSIGTAFIISVILIFFRLIFASFFSQIFTTIARPLWGARDTVGSLVQHTAVNLQPRSKLVSQVNDLEQQVKDLQIKNLELQTQVTTLSHDDIQELLVNANNLIIAKILSRPPYIPFDSLIIDKGVSAGIENGDVVYSSAGGALGTVTLAGSHSSQIFLYSSSGTVTQAIVARTGQSVSIHGVSGGNFDIQVPKDFDITVGDTLTDSGPSRAFIAQVYSIDAVSADSFKKVLLRLPKTILQLQWVGVGKGASTTQ